MPSKSILSRTPGCRPLCGLLRLLLAVLLSSVLPGRAAVQNVTLQPGLNAFGQHVVEPVEAVFTVQGVQVQGARMVLALQFPQRDGGPPGPRDADRQYTVEFDSGFWAAVEGWRPGGLAAGGNVRLVTRDPGVDRRPATGVVGRLRRVRTIREIFGIFAGCRLQTGTQHTADLVMVRSQNTWLTLYHSGRFNTTTQPLQRESWRIAGRDGNHPDLPIFFVQGIFVIRRGTAPVSFPLNGEVKTGPTLVNVDDPLVRYTTDRGEQWAFIANVHGSVDGLPPRTLDQSGLAVTTAGQGQPIPAGQNVDTSDNLVLYGQFQAGQPPGSYRRLFNSTTAERMVDAQGQPSGALPLSSAFAIHRRTAAPYYVLLNN